MTDAIPEGCVFCSTACESMSTYQDAPDDAPSYLLAEIDDFRILSDNAPLALGHVLIVPNEHVIATARLSPERLGAADRVVGQLRDAWRRVFDDPPLVFEHGTGGHDHWVGCCLDHAHLHLLPVGADIRDGFAEAQELAAGDSLADIHEVGERDYILTWTDDAGVQAWSATHLPSQVCRRLIGDRLDLSIWNWHDTLLLVSVDEQVRVVEANREAAMSALTLLESP